MPSKAPRTKPASKKSAPVQKKAPAKKAAPAKKSVKAYARAGVDVDLGNRVKAGLPALLARTHRPEVLGKAGGFGGLFRASFPGYKKPVLVASVDGVGTKLKVAVMMNKHDTVGADLVNHCIDDILTLGAEPLFFLDYIGAAKLEPAVFHQIIEGFTSACEAAGCALIGGETAQMPGMYQGGDYDLAGTIVGIVDEDAIIDGRSIRPGDEIVGLPSNGLHTNGYSLARKILFDDLKLKPSGHLPGLKNTVGAELLQVHRSYLKEVRLAKKAATIKGMAHITGGGLLDNVPRILPKNCNAQFRLGSWKVPTLFKLLVDAASLPREEAYQTFNMGLGYCFVVAPQDLKKVLTVTRGLHVGSIVKGSGKVKLVE